MHTLRTTQKILYPCKPICGYQLWKYYELRGKQGALDKGMQIYIQLCYSPAVRN